MKVVVDMNLSPVWIPYLEEAGYAAKHWSQIGSPSAPDYEIMDWARENNYIVFTHDLDFGALLFATKAKSPSVIQLRAIDIRPNSIGEKVLIVLRKAEKDLLQGVLITIDVSRDRIRLLPFK